MNMIEFVEVEKQYPDGTRAVESLSLEVKEGEATVFVGPSGCGKTTSLRMINRMIEPTRGHILIGGKDVTSLPKAELRQGIGYVIQNAGLFPHRSILENVMTVPRLQGTARNKARTRALELLELVGLPLETANRYPTQLSGGQQQRVGVARALAAAPKVLLMDEPFSALDPVVRAELQNEFRRLKHELGTTTVFVTHDIDEAIRVGDRIAILEAGPTGGRLAQYATPSELLSSPANEFVAEFIGRDRGYRSLSFVPFDREQLARITQTRTPAQEAVAGWQPSVTEDGVFQGWSNGAQIVQGGTFDLGNSVRTLVDATLLSPSSRTAVLDEDKKLLGTVGLEELASHGLLSAVANQPTIGGVEDD